MFKRFATVAMLVGSLVLVGCSSNKKQGADAEGSGNGKNGGLTLELNGDSDNMTAGGLSTVYFDFDSSTLGGATKKTLDGNADFLKANAKVDIQVEGHCDERGGIQYNLALGERRAKAVRDYLVALGIDKKRITTISYGKEKPLAFGHDESSWGKNRRANFVITAK